jgi:quinol monooxygenase YgiN
MIVLAAKCAPKPGRRDEIIRLAAAVTKLSKAEAGCMSYGFYEKPSGDHEFLFFEEWVDQAALDFHFQTPHFQEFIKRSLELLQAPPSIRIYDVGASRDLEL